MPIDSATYVAAAAEIFGRVAEREGANAGKAAELIVSSLRADGVVHAFGSGHSEGLAMEVELAGLVKGKGHALIAVTSVAHTSGLRSRHPSGRRLIDLADVVLDNGAPYGDAILPLPGGGKACAISSITGSLLVQMIIAEVIGSLLEKEETPPVYLSANVPEGDERNHDLEARYAGRIRRSA